MTLYLNAVAGNKKPDQVPLNPNHRQRLGTRGKAVSPSEKNTSTNSGTTLSRPFTIIILILLLSGCNSQVPINQKVDIDPFYDSNSSYFNYDSSWYEEACPDNEFIFLREIYEKGELKDSIGMTCAEFKYLLDFAREKPQYKEVNYEVCSVEQYSGVFPCQCSDEGCKAVCFRCDEND